MTKPDQQSVPFSSRVARVAADPAKRLEFFRWILNPDQPEKEIEVDGPDGKERVLWSKRSATAPSERTR